MILFSLNRFLKASCDKGVGLGRVQSGCTFCVKGVVLLFMSDRGEWTVSGGEYDVVRLR